MREEMLNNAVEMVNNRQFVDATTVLKELIEGEEQDIYFYKLYADVLGPLTGHDYNMAIDMYQKIVNECEDDALYESAQLSILDSYLNLSMMMITRNNF